MPPRDTGNCDPDIGGRNGAANVRVLKRDKGTSGPRTHSQRVVGKGNGCSTTAVEIPWRTSRRLQEATLRLFKERDSGQPHSHSSIKEEDDSESTESLPAARSSPKRQKQEDLADDPVQHGESPSGEKAETTSNILGPRGKLKRRRKFQFNEAIPLFIQDGKKAIAGISSNQEHSLNQVSTPEKPCSTASGREKVELTVAGSRILPGIDDQPQSCFDLLCSHVGLRGWRCYRSRISGQVFCFYHLRESKPVSRSGICLYT